MRNVHALTVVGAWIVVSACSQENSRPRFDGPGFDLTISALTLAGVGDAVWDIKVVNGAETPQTVMSQRLTAEQYGDGVGSLSYVAPCDASLSPVGTNQNTVIVSLIGIYASPVGNAGAWGDAAPGGSLPFVNPGVLSRTFTCLENQDTPVVFDVTVMRPANQGFFDIAVNFNDVFCSAKFDCLAGNLLHDEEGERARTFVLGFACTAGYQDEEDVDTVLYLNDIQIQCGSDTWTVDPDATDGNYRGPSGWVGVTGTSPGLFQVAAYKGHEQLPGYSKYYWNLAFGVGALPLTGCKLTTAGTADNATVPGLEDGAIAPGDIYPIIYWDIALDTCTEHGLNVAPIGGPNRATGTVASPSLVYTSYTATSPGSAAPNNPFGFIFAHDYPKRGPSPSSPAPSSASQASSSSPMSSSPFPSWSSSSSPPPSTMISSSPPPSTVLSSPPPSTMISSAPPPKTPQPSTPPPSSSPPPIILLPH